MQILIARSRILGLAHQLAILLWRYLGKIVQTVPYIGVITRPVLQNFVTIIHTGLNLIIDDAVHTVENIVAVKGVEELGGNQGTAHLVALFLYRSGTYVVAVNCVQVAQIGDTDVNETDEDDEVFHLR